MRSAALFLLLAFTVQACSPADGATARPERPPPPARDFHATYVGELARFTVTNDGRAPLAERVVSFGQIFPPGRIGPGSPLSVTLDGAAVQAQMDAKALNRDGSVRHAVISARLPAIRPGASLNGVISVAKQPDSASSPPIAPAAPPFSVTVRFQGDPSAITLDLVQLARDPRPLPTTWLSGPVVREQRYQAKAGGIDMALDVTTPVVGPARIDVILRNDAAQNKAIAKAIYRTQVRFGGRLLYDTAEVTHHPYQTWHAVLYADGVPPPRVTPDPKLLITLGATPHYGAYQPDPEVVEAMHASAMRPGPPLSGTANVTPYMPTTGGRADIGPLPAWAVFYLFDPSRQNHQTLFANADAAGVVPWHVRDVEHDGPISVERHPMVWLDYRGEPEPGVLERKYAPTDEVWAIDDGHQPSLTYLPYLLTGSQYYRDELAMQAGFVLLAVSPTYRRGAEGSVLPAQLRGIAWNLRTLATAAYILPTADPYQAYFEAKLRSNLDEMNRRFVQKDELAAAGELVGYVPGAYDEEHTAPWQDDYLVMVLGWIHAMGFTETRPILAWMTNFVAGRFTNAARGYDPLYGTAYEFHIADARSKAPLNTWASAFKASFDPSKGALTSLDQPDWAGGYAALARASLASLNNAAPSPRAAAAYAYVKAQTPRMEASYSKEPAFAIVPIRGGAR
ncbi:hypothetical protein [Caulobacter segnis]